jgi:CRISPR type III-A-associated RAMP protein Csm5
VQVSDTQPVEGESLEIGLIWTVAPDRESRLGQKQKIFVEQIRANQSLEFSIKIDKWLFRAHEKKVLNFSDQQEKVICEEMAEACNFVAKGIIEDELNFFDYYKLPEMVNFYESLVSRLEGLPNDAFVLPIAWGTGHHTKTVTDLVVEGDEAPDDFMMRLRQHYRLGKSRSGGDYYDPEFPKTRRILYHGPKPISPLGWVQISPKE